MSETFPVVSALLPKMLRPEDCLSLASVTALLEIVAAIVISADPLKEADPVRSVPKDIVLAVANLVAVAALPEVFAALFGMSALARLTVVAIDIFLEPSKEMALDPTLPVSCIVLAVANLVAVAALPVIFISRVLFT
jgi:hypothetical protein